MNDLFGGISSGKKDDSDTSDSDEQTKVDTTTAQVNQPAESQPAAGGNDVADLLSFDSTPSTTTV